MRKPHTRTVAALFIVWVMLPAPAAGHGICQDGSPPVFDIEALCAGSEVSDQPPCNEQTYLSYVRSGEKARRKRAELVKQTGTGCQLVEANFEGQTFHKKYFMRADLTKANLAGATFESFSFRDAILPRAQLREATFIDGSFNFANLRKADLTRARFQDVHFYKTNFKKAQLSGADLRGAELLHDANLNGAVYDEHTQFPADFDPQAAGMRRE